jgi:hypothetical protein
VPTAVTPSHATAVASHSTTRTHHLTLAAHNLPSRKQAARGCGSRGTTSLTRALGPTRCISTTTYAPHPPPAAPSLPQPSSTPAAPSLPQPSSTPAAPSLPQPSSTPAARALTTMGCGVPQPCDVIAYTSNSEQVVCDTRPMPEGSYNLRLVVDGMRQVDHDRQFVVSACALPHPPPCPPAWLGSARRSAASKSRANAAARLDRDVSAGWASSSSRGLCGGNALLPSTGLKEPESLGYTALPHPATRESAWVYSRPVPQGSI